jgi:glutaredoxin
MDEKVDIIVYSKDNCPWCEKAIDLLTQHNMPHRVLKLGVDFSKEELQNRVGKFIKLTVPQIFINGESFGGYEDLKAYLTVAQNMEKLNDVSK